MSKGKKQGQNSLAFVYEAGIRHNMTLLRNAPTALLYEHEVRSTPSSKITDTGALSVLSGVKTGRSPKDKRVCRDAGYEQDVWWGNVNIPIEPENFANSVQRAIDYMNTKDLLFITDCFTGWDTNYRKKVRVITTRAYHALFMKTMLIEPTEQELQSFGKPDFVIWNAGTWSASKLERGVTSQTMVGLSFERMEMAILGTEYAGEMKKGVLTLMMYLLPKAGQLTMHASANEGIKGDVTVFFGLSGTGKTTLSADPHRKLIGDDEHVWTDHGVFNIEGGCYAKAIGLSKETEPDIYGAIRFGCVVENVVMNDRREIQYNDISLTENTRCAYPLGHIENTKNPAVGGHPKNVILLTNDAFGCLPAVSKLTSTQAMYQFISGYTAKVPGTEVGVTEPTPTFSACFAGPFLVWHPTVYAKQLAERLQKYNAPCWLVNTGWVAGRAGSAPRMKLKWTRKIIDAIHDGSLLKVEYEVMPGWGFHVPKSCPGVPSEMLLPYNAWKDKQAYVKQINELAKMFRSNFKKYEDKADPALKAANPGEYMVSSKL
jgi:phosphoenolpyruvate carboxykinase (ATP)